MERLKQVTLLLTRACNLRCSYCYVRTYSGGEMTLETAKGIVRDVFARDLSGYDGVEFIFLGGEPFCAFPLRWYMGDGTIVRAVAFIDEDKINKDVPDRVYKYGVD